MGNIFHFIIGFIGGIIGGFIGVFILSLIVGFIFPPALFVVIPLGLIVILKSGWENGVERVEGHQYAKKIRRNKKAEEKRKIKLRNEFDQHELFEFDRAWKETFRNAN